MADKPVSLFDPIPQDNTAPITLGEVLALAVKDLQAAQVDSPELSARILTAAALGLTDIEIITEKKNVPSPPELERVRRFILRRARGEPAAYILGYKEFYGLDFNVTPAVLIPRPDTELIIDIARRLFSEHEELVFADLGTGSGALAATAAVFFPRSTGFAVDVSRQALHIARGNLHHHNAAERVVCLGGRFSALPFRARSLDLVMANPPYVSRSEYQSISREIHDFEPISALVPTKQDGREGTEDALDVAASSALALKPGGYLLMEIGETQAESLLGSLQHSEAGWEPCEVIKDAAGKDRVIRARKV